MRNFEGTGQDNHISNINTNTYFITNLYSPQPTFTHVPPMGKPSFTILTEAANGAAAAAAANAAEPPPALCQMAKYI